MLLKLIPGSDEKNMSNWKQLFREHGILPDVVRRIPANRAEVILQPDGIRVKTGASVGLKHLKETPKFRWKSDPKELYALFVLNPDVPSRREAFEVKPYRIQTGPFMGLILPTFYVQLLHATFTTADRSQKCKKYSQVVSLFCAFGIFARKNCS